MDKELVKSNLELDSKAKKFMKSSLDGVHGIHDELN